MKKLVCTLLLLALACVAAAPDATGKWSGTFSPEGGESNAAYMVLKQTGASITGTAGPDADTQWTIQTGKADGNKIMIEVTDPDGAVYKCTMLLDGDHLKGDVEATAQGQTRKGKIDLTRVS
jgi:hypothetical protein